MCLRAQGIDDNGEVGIVRQDRRLSNDDGGVGRGRGILNASEGSETMTKAARSRQRAQGIYDNNGGVRGGRLAQRLQQQQQRMRQCSIDNASNGLKTTTEAAADQRRGQWIGNDNGVLIFLAFRLTTVTLSPLCLVVVSFWYFFSSYSFFFVSCI